MTMKQFLTAACASKFMLALTVLLGPVAAEARDRCEWNGRFDEFYHLTARYQNKFRGEAYIVGLVISEGFIVQYQSDAKSVPLPAQIIFSTNGRWPNASPSLTGAYDALIRRANITIVSKGKADGGKILGRSETAEDASPLLTEKVRYYSPNQQLRLYDPNGIAAIENVMRENRHGLEVVLQPTGRNERKTFPYWVPPRFEKARAKMLTQVERLKRSASSGGCEVASDIY